MFQRGAEAPADWQLDGGAYLDLVGAVAHRIQRDGVPLQADDFRRDHHAALGPVQRRQVFELGDQHGGTRRHIDTKAVDVQRIAAPGQRLAIDAETQAAQLVHRPVRAMVAGQPLRVIQVDRASFDRNFFAHAEDAMAQVGGIHRQRQDPLIRVGGQACIGLRRRVQGRGQGKGKSKGYGTCQRGGAMRCSHGCVAVVGEAPILTWPGFVSCAQRCISSIALGL